MNLLNDSVELLRRMVAIPSLSYEEENVRNEIGRTLDSWGVEHRFERNNIIALKRSTVPGAKTLLLDAHIDTVPASAEYAFDPFEPDYAKAAEVLADVIDGDFVCGLGCNDDGGCVVTMIAAFRHFLDKDLPFNLMLALSCEEERSGSDGTRWLFDSDGPLNGKGDLPKPDWALVGEPTGMRAATSERGLLVLDGLAEGVSGHAGRGEGVNALYIALDDIKKLRDYKFEKVSPVMGAVRMTVTQIQAGTAHNVVPDLCSFVVDIRPTDSYTNPEIVELLQGFCKSKLKARNLLNCSSATLPDSPLKRCAEGLGIETFSSPTTSDWMRMDCDAIKMGPGQSTRSHKANEYILVSELKDGLDKYIEFIDNFYGNTLE